MTISQTQTTQMLPIKAITALLVPMVLAVVAFWDAITSAISVWYINDTFNHCFLVIPISLYFAWENRYRVARCEPRINPLVLLPIAGLFGLWLLGAAADIKLFQHVAFFLLIPSLVWLLYGNQVARVLWFPLMYFVFAIPVGEEAIPFFQEITANMCVWLLNVTGIPVFREGLYLSVPGGMFEVAEACSGVRFFIACISLGAVFTYMNYRVWWKAAAFMSLAIIFPIIANGFRAYGIILVGYLSGMEHAVGADHLIYGWFFFSIVLIVMFAMGYPFIDKPEPTDNSLQIHSGWHQYPWQKALGLALAPVIIVLAFKLMFAAQRDAQVTPLALELSQFESQQIAREYSWHPTMAEPTREWMGQFGPEQLDFYLAWYADNFTQGSELIHSQSRVFNIDHWSRTSDDETKFIERESAPDIELRLLTVASTAGRKRLIAYWYDTPMIATASALKIKLAQAVDIITGGRGEGAMVALSVDYELGETPPKDWMVEQIKMLTPELTEALYGDQ